MFDEREREESGMTPKFGSWEVGNAIAFELDREGCSGAGFGGRPGVQFLTACTWDVY